MDKTTVKILSTRDKIYTTISEELGRLNDENPFGYYFIGASSATVLQMAKTVSERNKAYIRSNFFAIDEFIVWIFKNLRNDYLFLNTHQEYSLIKNYLFNSNNSAYKKYSKSPSIIRESIGLIQEIHKNLIYKDWDTINKNVKGSGFLKEIREFLFKNNRIDKAYVYNFFLKGETKQLDYIEDEELSKILNDKTLVFYGFFDIPDAMKEILKRFIKAAKSSVFYSVYERENFKKERLFEETEEYLKKFLGKYDLEDSPEIDLKRFDHQINKFKDERLEQDYICYKIKELLKDNVRPEKIGVIYQNSSRIKSLARKMEEYHIPYRIRNNVSLFESRVVKIILLPFLMQSRGYQSEDIVSYMELNGDNKIRDIYIKAKLDFFFSNSIEIVRENWIKGIDKYIEYLNKKVELIKNSKDENDKFAKMDAKSTEGYIEIIKDEKKKIEKVFEDLKEYETANKDLEKFKEKLSERTDEIRKKIHIEDRNTEEEQRALGKFSKVAYQFIEMMENYGEFEGNLGNMLKEICVLETYIPTEFFNNTVEIFSLNDARYSEKEYLFVSGFINGEYPLSQNKILYNDDGYKKIFEIKDPYYKTYRQSKLHLYMSLAGTKKAFFTYFDEDISGNPKTPSVFLDDFTDKNKEEVTNDNRMMEIEKTLSESQALSMAMMNNKVIESLKDKIGSISLSAKKFLNKKESMDLAYYDQTGKPFSFSQFQTYVECPYKYFIKYFLHFKQKEEISFGVSPLDEGILMHEALRDFMKYVKRVYNGSITKDNKIECANKLKEIIEEKFKKYVFVFNEKYMDFWKKKILSYADKIIEKEIKESKKHRSNKLEQPFKNLKIGGIKFEGQIDRIDSSVIEKGKVKTYVIDYKSSAPNAKHKKYQLYLYILSMEKEGYEQPIKAFFYIYKKGSYNNLITYKDGVFNYDKKEDKQFKKEKIEEAFRTFGNYIKDGLFNIKVSEANEKKDDVVFSMIERDEEHNNYCNYCPLKNFCNRGEI